MLPENDATVAAELERKHKVKADRQKREEEQEEEKSECERWKSLHMSLAEQRSRLSDMLTNQN